MTHVWVHGDDLVDFRIGDDVVTTTEDHPFWNATDRQWEGPQKFDAGDRVLTADGNLLVTRGLVADSWHTGSAYNLTVNDIHTFYVIVAGEAVLVHNCNILGKGSTGRTVPYSGVEADAMDAVVRSPQAGTVLPTKMEDGRWPENELWVKMEQEVDGVNIHYVWQQGTDNYDDFKFVDGVG